jgi:hypothetical protein
MYRPVTSIGAGSGTLALIGFNTIGVVVAGLSLAFFAVSMFGIARRRRGDA